MGNSGLIFFLREREFKIRQKIRQKIWVSEWHYTIKDWEKNVVEAFILVGIGILTRKHHSASIISKHFNILQNIKCSAMSFFDSIMTCYFDIRSYSKWKEVKWVLFKNSSHSEKYKEWKSKLSFFFLPWNLGSLAKHLHFDAVDFSDGKKKKKGPENK